MFRAAPSAYVVSANHTINEMFYTYIHKRPDDGQAFYVGKGKGNRALYPHGRSAHWKSVVKKHGGFAAEVTDGFESEQEAFAHERFLIASLRVFGCKLINKTNGGDGVSGLKHSEETRRRLSEINKGRVASETTRRRMSDARAGVPRPDLRGKRGPFSEETRQKMRKPKSERARASMRAARAKQRKPVFCVSHEKNFESVCDAADWLKLNGFPKASKSAITEACQGKRVHAYGMFWKYA